MPCGSSDQGQGSVEFVALLPLLCAGAAVAWQLALVGHTAWSAHSAARAASRAAAVGAPPASVVARRVRVVSVRDGLVHVRVRIPQALGIDFGSVRARAAFAVQEER